MHSYASVFSMSNQAASNTLQTSEVKRKSVSIATISKRYQCATNTVVYSNTSLCYNNTKYSLKLPRSMTT